MRQGIISTVIGLALLAAATVSFAAAPGDESPGLQKAAELAGSLRLTPDFLDRQLAMTEEMQAHPCKLMYQGAALEDDSEAVARWASRPAVKEMLDRHGLTAEDAVYGGLRLAAAMGAAPDLNLKISDAEMAAVQAYKKKIMANMKNVSGEELQARLDKMKSCGLL